MFSVDPASIVTFAFNNQTPSLLSGSLYKALFSAPPSCSYISVKLTGALHETVIVRVVASYVIHPDSGNAYAGRICCSSDDIDKLAKANVENISKMAVVTLAYSNLVERLAVRVWLIFFLFLFVLS